MRRNFMIVFVLLSATFFACKTEEKPVEEVPNPMKIKVDEFANFKLTTDLTVLTDKEKQMLPYLFQAADIMNELFWLESYGENKDTLLKNITCEYTKRFVELNYGPWERLNNNTPFVTGVGAKPKGANFYPTDMTEQEFASLTPEQQNSLYTIIRRDENGALISIPYNQAFNTQVTKAAELIKKAAGLAEDAGLKNYLELRAEALLTDNYYPSDTAWMSMKTNTIDFVIGPIESYEDGYGKRAAHEAFILVKDKEWSKKLERFAALLPKLQKDLPVDDKYKTEVPGSDSDLGAYDVIYYAGDCNAGSKTIAINLPNDEKVQSEKGSRKLQLKNAMKAKFEKILVPISNLMIDESQRKHVTFDAFFENTMFHEVGHGLGIQNTITGAGAVREVLGSTYTTMEEGKADILGLFLITKLHEMGELSGNELMDNYVTFMAGIFRSSRFGAASAHGKANMIRFYYFEETGAFTKDATTGLYKVNFEKMKEAMNSLAKNILVIQGDGDIAAAEKMIAEKGFVRPELQADLDKIGNAGIPIDIYFEQGIAVLGL